MNPALNEAAEAYRAALKEGRRFVAEQNAAGRSGLLPVFEPKETCGDVPLGLIELPIKKIRGTYAAGRSHALSGSFMPLLGEDSEFSGKWKALYASALEKGITEPIRAFEYMGYCYVLEGHKRVSAASVLSNYSLSASVTRLMPPPGGETAEAAVFLELLGGNKQKVIRHMWFSVPGRFTELRGLCGGDETLLEDAFAAFRAVYHKRGFNQALPDITTGDAFWQYAKLYGLPAGENEAALSKKAALCRPQWESLSCPEPVRTVSGPDGAVSKPLFYIPRGAPPSVTFAYCVPPQSAASAEAHEAGRFALRRAFPEIVTQSAEGLSPDVPGDVIFATHPALSDAALRTALEQKNKLVMLCRDEPAGFVSTYHIKTEEAAFLMGVLAGSLSKAARIGCLYLPHELGGLGENLQALACGASAARPASHIFMARADDPGAFTRMAERGVDIIAMPQAPYGVSPAPKAFPGVCARLCELSGGGIVQDMLAAAAWHWGAFYEKFIRSVVEGGFPSDSLHIKMGLDSGALDIHLTARAARAKHCLAAFRQALMSGLLAPADENNPVEIYEV
ncbi:MAG: hypothetical protein FWG72_04035 [Oscillospiraceae bacterium]|nr:hypothetical protein [Oscillospiraceae bacterium]